MSEGVLIAEKKFFKKSLFGHISRGGGLIEISNGKAIKFIAINNDFVTLQIIEYGMGKQIQTQSWQKVVKEKVIVEKEVKPKLIQQSKIIPVKELKEEELL